MSISPAHRLLSSPLWLAGPARRFGDAAASRLRHRRGQNLSDRYRRLEKSLQEKQELARHIGHLFSPPVVTPAVLDAAATTTPEKLETFHGFKVPKEPPPPRDDECCMSNCAVCVYDLYEESLEAYRKSVADLRTLLSALNIPEAEWPQNIRASDSEKTPSRKDVVLNAFEEMERALKKKRQSQEASADADAASLPCRIVTPSLGVVGGSKSKRHRHPWSWTDVPAGVYEGLQWILYSRR